MRRVPSRLPSFALTVLVGLVFVHDVVFLRTFGDDRAAALAATGHPQAWGSIVLGVLGLGLGVAIVAGVGLWRMAWRGRALGPGTQTAPGRVGEALGWLLGEWASLAASIALLFMLQEDVEHLAVHQALPGLGVFGSPAYHDGLAILALVTFLLAATRTLYRSTRARVLARIAADPRPRPRPARVRRRPEERAVAPTERSGRRWLGLAPPAARPSVQPDR